MFELDRDDDKEEMKMATTFGERLSALIKGKNLTQKELATRAGVTEAAMSHYVKGDRIPRASVCARIADELETTTEYLMNGTSKGVDEEVKLAIKLIARNASQMSGEEKMQIVKALLGNE